MGAYPGLESRAWVVRNGFEPAAEPDAPAARPDQALGARAGWDRGAEIALAPLLRGIDRVADSGRARSACGWSGLPTAGARPPTSSAGSTG